MVSKTTQAKNQLEEGGQKGAPCPAVDSTASDHLRGPHMPQSMCVAVQVAPPGTRVGQPQPRHRQRGLQRKLPTRWATPRRPAHAQT